MRGKCYWHEREWGGSVTDMKENEGEVLLTWKRLRGKSYLHVREWG